MNCTELRDRIRQQGVGAQDKRLFLVEGRDDQTAWQVLLDRFVPGWEASWGLAEAGNKSKLLCLLDLEPNWLGLVDRDEWDETLIANKTAQTPNLLVLPRFCLENYLIDPDELWPAIPAARQAALAGGKAALAGALHGQLHRYLRHGALWIVVTPLWTGLRALGFKEALASADSIDTAQHDDKIRGILGDRDTFREPRRILTEFEAQLVKSRAAPVSEQYARWVHGKHFWENVVNPTMTSLFGQMAEKRRRIEILRQIPRPADLRTVFDAIGT